MSSASYKREQRRRELQSIELVVVGDVVWTRVDGRDGVAWEYERRRGAVQRRIVDVGVYCYVMLCACGRERYAKPNTLYEVTRCRVCQYDQRVASRRKKD